MSDETMPILPSATDVQSTMDNTNLHDMFTKFLKTNEEDRLRHQAELSAMKSVVDRLSENSSLDSTSDHVETPPDRRQNNRRTSIFFSAPSANKTYAASRQRLSSATLDSPLSPRPAIPATPSVIQVLQAEIVYENQLKVSSLEGLTFLSKQLQIMNSKYPGREIKTAHMVAVPLRQHVVASWNSFLRKHTIATGIEEPEVMVNDWLSFDNDLVQDMLLEAARPRTREQYSQELVRFLLKAVPQFPEINAENFSKFYFDPLMKSLHDLLHLHDLLSADTSNVSNNSSKMPSTSYGTKENPGHIQLWIISLGSHKDAILQWLGKDELSKHKTLAPAVKYIRNKLMVGRSQSEDRQDFQHQLTPIKYDDIRRTQGESHQRQQVYTSRTQHQAPSSYRSYDNKTRASMAALDFRDSVHTSPDEYSPQPFDLYDDDDVPPTDLTDNYENSSVRENHSETDSYNADTVNSSAASYCALSPSQSFRSAISATFRGYCSELFVYGKCSKRDAGCAMDHSSAAQERCINSFALLSKRELSRHADLPSWQPLSTASSKYNSTAPYSDARSLRPQPSFIQPRTYGNSGGSVNHTTPSRPYLK
jgi:hypothetical protein